MVTWTFQFFKFGKRTYHSEKRLWIEGQKVKCSRLVAECPIYFSLFSFVKQLLVFPLHQRIFSPRSPSFCPHYESSTHKRYLRIVTHPILFCEHFSKCSNIFLPSFLFITLKIEISHQRSVSTSYNGRRIAGLRRTRLLFMALLKTVSPLNLRSDKKKKRKSQLFSILFC